MNLPIAKIGYGCYALSGAYGTNLSSNEKIKILNYAFELGITYFDTASSYEQTEELLGEVFKSKRDQITISTKIDANIQLSKTNVLKSCEASLRKLKTDYIDLYQVHYHDPNTPIDDVIEGLEKLVQGGKIRYYGIGHLPLDTTKLYLSKGNIASVLAEVSVLSLYRYQELASLFPVFDFGIVAFGCTGRGILGNIDKETLFSPNDIRSIDPLYKRERLKNALFIKEKLAIIAEELNISVIQLALLWVINQKRIVKTLIGPTNINHLIENVEVINKELPQNIIEAIDQLVQKAHSQLEVILAKEINTILDSTTSASINDLIYVLEYCLEHNKISYQDGVKIFSEVMAVKKRNNYSQEVIKKLKIEIRNNIGSSGVI